MQRAQAAGSTANFQWQLRLKPVSVLIHGTRYSLLAGVVDGQTCEDGEGCDPYEDVAITVTSRVKSSTASAVQRNFFDFPHLQPDSNGFRHTASLSSASVRGHSDFSGQLRIDLGFTASSPVRETCNGHSRSRTGDITGTLYFKPPDSTIGAIRRVASHATLAYGDGACMLKPLPDPVFVPMKPCPPGTVFAVGASPGSLALRIIARHDPDASTANIYAWSGGDAGYVWYTVHATVPADHFVLPNNLSKVTISGAPGSYFHGSASAPAKGAPGAWPIPFDCQTMGAGALIDRDMDALDGNLTVRFWAGGARSTASTPVHLQTYLVAAAP